jgi:hypothetical protein
MMIMEGTVKKTDFFLRLPLSPITGGCKNSVFLHLRFSPHWRAYPYRYVDFHHKKGERMRARVDEDGVCILPEEILRRSGIVFLSVVGCDSKEETKRVVTEVATFKILPSSYTAKAEVKVDGE